jgi:hypothetical protein
MIFFKKQQNLNQTAAQWKKQLLKTIAVYEVAGLIQMAFVFVTVKNPPTEIKRADHRQMK